MRCREAISKLASSASSAALACLLMAMPSSVRAQKANDPSPTATDTGGLNAGSDIVVTAQRREQRLQDVPIAITALDSQTLEDRGITDLRGLAGAVPGVAIASYAGVNATAVTSIRGIAGQVLPIGSGQAVAYYLDGVYLPRPDAAFFSLDDVERLEVLRGPQGTLYGRNSTGGAINIITRDPGNQLRGGVELSYGNYNSISAKASVSGPIGGGLSAGISGGVTHRDGYIKNIVTGNDLNAAKSATVRGKLRYEPDDGRFSAVLAVNYSKNDNTPIFKNAHAFPTASYLGYGDPDEVSLDIVSERFERSVARTAGGSIILNFDATDQLSFTSISSYSDTKSDTGYDVDASAVPAALARANNRSKSVNQEIRGVYEGERLTLTFGGNFFHEDSYFTLGNGGPPVVATETFARTVDKSKLDAWALFTQAEYKILPNVTLVGGLRYNNEKRTFSVDSRQLGGFFVPGEVKDDVFIPSAGINFDVAPQIMLYGKVSRGYQAPGFNFLPGAFVETPDYFLAEKLWAYEVGAKSQFWDRRITLNVAAFRYDYENLQVRSQNGIGVTKVLNAGPARNQGAEASLAINLDGGFSLGAQATYLDSKYLDFCQSISAGDPQAADPLCAPGIADRSGNRLNLAPKWSGGIRAGYDGSLGTAGKFSANVTYDFSSSVYYLGPSNENVTASGKWGILGASASYTLESGLELFIFGRNLTDKRYLGYAARVSPVILFQAFNDPRTYGGGIRFRL